MISYWDVKRYACLMSRRKRRKRPRPHQNPSVFNNCPLYVFLLYNSLSCERFSAGMLHSHSGLNQDYIYIRIINTECFSEIHASQQSCIVTISWNHDLSVKFQMLSKTT